MTTSTVQPARPNLESRTVAWDIARRSAAAIVTDIAAHRDARRISTNGQMLHHALAAVGISITAAKTGHGLPVAISQREREVLYAMSVGKSNPTIAADLDIAKYTVETHIRSLFRKLGVTDRAHAVAEGFRWGLLA